MENKELEQLKCLRCDGHGTILTPTHVSVNDDGTSSIGGIRTRCAYCSGTGIRDGFKVTNDRSRPLP